MVIKEIHLFQKRVVAEIVVTSHGQYQAEYSFCHKKDCKCNRSLGHGPYWYLYTPNQYGHYCQYIGQRPKEWIGTILATWENPDIAITNQAKTG